MNNWIGKPLVVQSFNQERFEANYRFGLIRIREHAEAVILKSFESGSRDMKRACHMSTLERQYPAIKRD